MGIVLKASVQERITGTIFWEWFIIENLEEKVEVTKEEALDYIERNGLVVAYETREGKVWDTPDGEFQRRNKGKFNGKIERLWEK